MTPSPLVPLPLGVAEPSQMLGAPIHSGPTSVCSWRIYVDLDRGDAVDLGDLAGLVRVSATAMPLSASV